MTNTGNGTFANQCRPKANIILVKSLIKSSSKKISTQAKAQVCLVDAQKQQTCVDIDPKRDNKFPASGVVSMSAPSDITFLVQCEGKLVTAKQSIPSLSAACDGKPALFWKAVKPSIVQFRNEFLIYASADVPEAKIPGGFTSSLTKEHINLAAKELKVSFPWWIRWLSNGLIQMKIKSRVASNPLKLLSAIDKGWTAFAPETASDLPKRGKFDGVFVYFNVTGKDATGAPKDVGSGSFWTQGGGIVSENDAGYSVMLPSDDQAWRDSWKGGCISGFIHEWLHQIEGMADRRGKSPDVKLHGDDSRYTVHKGEAPIAEPGEWFQWYRDFMLNDNVRGIPIEIWKAGNIRSLLTS
jgi:hypothetical protein